MPSKVILDPTGNFPHCIDGPAKIHADGLSKEWYVSGRRHRLDGPAVIIFDVDKYGKTSIVRQEWWVHGKLHREDGPAIYAANNRGYCPVIIGSDIRRLLNIDGYEVTQSSGWYKNGKLHREDGPAVSLSMRLQENVEIWYKDGKIHNDNNPAVTSVKQTTILSIWYKKNNIHRDGDLPAWITESSSTNSKVLKWYKKGYLHRETGPAELSSYGEFAWYKNGFLHRDGDLPAKFSNTFNEIGWYKNGKFHRENGPCWLKFGRTILEINWKIDGRSHRTDGPAYIVLNRYGHNDKISISSSYYIDGLYVKLDKFLDKIKDNSINFIYSKYMISEDEGCIEEARKYVDIGIELRAKILEEYKEAIKSEGLLQINATISDSFQF